MGKEPITERLRQLLQENGMSVTTLSNELSVSQSTLNRQITGKSELTYSMLHAILEYYPTVSSEWLIRGVGNMFNDNPNICPQELVDENKRLKEENNTLNMKIDFLTEQWERMTIKANDLQNELNQLQEPDKRQSRA